jgi:hypothetical protein
MNMSGPLMRSLLFLPGNREKFLEKALALDADGFIIDFEDSVPVAEKAAARKKSCDLCPGAARKIDLGSAERAGHPTLPGRPRGDLQNSRCLGIAAAEG